uniref:Uncharacterized protein n=1 Tax=Anguilla anguilla TaxID=7936 RepID=A0A0E9VP77_ANGAN
MSTCLLSEIHVRSGDLDILVQMCSLFQALNHVCIAYGLEKMGLFKMRGGGVFLLKPLGFK